MTVNTLK